MLLSFDVILHITKQLSSLSTAKYFLVDITKLLESLKTLGLASVMALHDTKNENEQNQRKSEDWHSCSAKETVLRRKKLTMTSSNVTSFPLWEVDVEQ